MHLINVLYLIIQISFIKSVCFQGLNFNYLDLGAYLTSLLGGEKHFFQKLSSWQSSKSAFKWKRKHKCCWKETKSFYLRKAETERE